VTVPLCRLPAALLGLALAAVLAGCAGTPAPEAAGPSSPSSSSSTSTGTAAAGQRIEAAVRGGTASGDTGRVPVTLGAHVTLVVTSDVADEVHLHGYDEEAELSPGQPTEIELDATIPGVFEVELHRAGTTLLSLQVQ
jgi:hypothetical protein